jgi:hypothetical protein
MCAPRPGREAVHLFRVSLPARSAEPPRGGPCAEDHARRRILDRPRRRIMENMQQP